MQIGGTEFFSKLEAVKKGIWKGACFFSLLRRIETDRKETMNKWF